MKENEIAIDVSGIDMSFGRSHVVRGLDLKVKKGSVMALLGANGAGKTTTLQVLAGIYQASSGGGSVLGTPLGCPATEFYQKVGYVSENQQLPKSWKLDQLINYLKPQYPTWDDVFCEELIMQFELPRCTKIGKMSRGMQMKVAMMAGLAFRPELLLLDEPFSGLDSLTREEFIDGILELMDGENWTMLLSSHDIHEVQRLCDEVSLLEQGQVVISEPLDELQARFRQWTIHTESERSLPEHPEGWLAVEPLGKRGWSLVETQHDPVASGEMIETFFGPLVSQECHSMSLQDIYLVLAKALKSQRRTAKSGVLPHVSSK